MEIAKIEYNEGQNRLVLESVDNSSSEYRFVWKGNSRSKDGFINRPAYFEWDQLGKLIRKSFDSGEIHHRDITSFLFNLLDIE